MSRCLLGEAVRYDGGSRHVPWITEVLSHHCRLLPLCPEVEAGFGVPRPPIRLVGDQERIEVQLVEDPSAYRTDQLSAAIGRLLPVVEQLDGLILKARSPSCGVHDTPLFDTAGESTPGAGLFTRACLSCKPQLVIVDEQALVSEAGRVGFLLQLFRRHHFPTL
ncbi:MAG: DUF523 domain-containing protein [Gammaproteobacteria bacterium]|nr:DUF523 domain-containing protein [Gammaproteobacteria bacterium]